MGRPTCVPGGCPVGQACALGTCLPLPLPDSDECAPLESGQSGERVRRDELIDLVEQARLSGGTDCGNGVISTPTAALRLDARLFCAAHIFAEDLAARGGRTLTDSSGQNTPDRMARVGYSAETWAEGFGVDASGPAQGWSLARSATEFCAYFAESRLTDMGVAVSGTVYVITLGTEQ